MTLSRGGTPNRDRTHSSGGTYHASTLNSLLKITAKPYKHTYRGRVEADAKEEWVRKADVTRQHAPSPCVCERKSENSRCSPAHHKHDLQAENRSLYSHNEVSVDQKQIWGRITLHSRSSSRCTSIIAHQKLTLYSLFKGNITVAMHTRISTGFSLFLLLYRVILKILNHICNFLQTVLRPSPFFMRLLHCGGLQELYRVSVTDEGSRWARWKTHTRTHASRARWVTAARRNGVNLCGTVQD